MEKALLLSPSEAERAVPLKTLPYATLIVGSEFCQNQLPSLAALKGLARRFSGVKLALATAFVTDKGLRRWERLLASLPRGLVSEVIVNDWGLLPALKKHGPFALSAGRLLMRELAGMDKGWTAAFLKDAGITAAETDTPGLAAAAARLRLKTSSHRPLVFTAVTTFCPFEKHFRAECGHSCENRLVKLENRHLPLPLYLGEKAYFAPRKDIPPRSRRPWREVWTHNFLRNVARPGRENKG